jgi:hypothetical protein
MDASRIFELAQHPPAFDKAKSEAAPADFPWYPTRRSNPASQGRDERAFRRLPTRSV